MRVIKEIKQEKQFSETYTDIARTKFNVTSTENLDGAKLVKLDPGYNSYYYSKSVLKTKIVLHNTVGVLRSDIAALTKKNWHVSVPYVIARDGTIYELFDPSYWSYHLGKGAIGGNKFNSRSSIAIELSSYGPLKRVGDDLETMYSQVSYINSKGNSSKTRKDIYCSVNEPEYFTKLAAPYRDYTYFAGYTDAQLKSLKALTNYLCEKFNIPKTLLDEPSRYELFKSSAEAKNYKGICSHVNFISKGKWDIGPEMDWSIFSDDINIELDEINIISNNDK